jgi:hypothetical protein
LLRSNALLVLANLASTVGVHQSFIELLKWRGAGVVGRGGRRFASFSTSGKRYRPGHGAGLKYVYD